MKYYAIFSGGGVKGIAFIGAVYALEQRGFVIKKAGGTSIGAIIASLLVSGYSAKDLFEIIKNIDFNTLKNDYNFKNIKNFSLSNSDKIKELLNYLYHKKNITYFKDLKKENEYLLKVTTTSIKYKKQLIIPDDLYLLNTHPDFFKVIDAVMMSSTYPLVYAPYKINDHYFLDGGIINKINLDLFKEEVGLKICFRLIRNINYAPFTFINDYVIINIPVRRKTFDFNLTEVDLINLFNTGYQVTTAWIQYYLHQN